MIKTKKKVMVLLTACVMVAAFVTYFTTKESKDTVNTSQPTSQVTKEQRDPTKHEYADVDFAKKMVLVEQQTMQIADIASTKSVDTQVRTVAGEISNEAKSDNQKYIGWLNAWNEQYLNLSDFPEME